MGGAKEGLPGASPPPKRPKHPNSIPNNIANLFIVFSPGVAIGRIHG